MNRLTTVFLALLLSGCATGIKMSDEEAAACRRDGCTVWTQSELEGLALEAMRQGFVLGAKSRGQGI